MSTFTYTRLLVPAQYEKEEATMTVAFDDIGQAAEAREVAVREVRTALRLVPAAAPEKKEEATSPLPGTAVSSLPGLAATESTAEASPSPLPGAASNTLPGASATPLTPTSVPASTGASWEWTKQNVRAFCQEAVERLSANGGAEAASAKVVEIIGQFASKQPALASEIEPGKRAPFVAAVDALQ